MQPEYVNFNGVVFGSIIMAAADYAFSLAINSMILPNFSLLNLIFTLSQELQWVTSWCGQGRVLRSGRRVGISEMTVTNQNGK